MQLAEMNFQIAVLATLATILMIGLGFLRNPARATRLWALAFMVTMLGTFGLIAAEVGASDVLRAVSLSAILATPTLLWAGVRAKFDKPSLVWVGLAQGVLGAALLVGLVDTSWYTLAYRVVLAAAGTFAALTAVELISSPHHGLGMLLPLTIISSLVPMLALATLIVTVRALADGSGEPEEAVTVSVLAIPVYLVCAIVSLLWLASAETETESGRRSGLRLSRVALNDRLARAEARQETSWSLLYITLDDVVDIRLAVGDGAFADVIGRFGDQVRGAFPTEADIEFRKDTTALVLITRPEATVRANVRSLLNSVSTLSPGQPLAVQMSASVGWATTSTTGYGLDDLVRAASAAAVDARLAGGDRWVRVEPDAARAAR